MNKIILKIPLFLILIILNTDLISQGNQRPVLGITLQTMTFPQRIDFGVSLGRYSGKNYSQINLTYGIDISPDEQHITSYSINIDPFKSYGFGYTHRYFTKNPFSLFSGFFYGDIVYSRYSCINSSPALTAPTKVDMNVIGIFLGYGISLNLLSHFTLCGSGGIGYNYGFGTVFYTTAFYQKESSYQTYDPGFQLKISLLYHLGGF